MREPDPGLVITGVGASSSVGSNAAQTCASIRAQLNRFAEYPYDVLTADPEWDDPEPLIAAASSVDLDLDGPQRLLPLALPALLEAIKSARILRAQLPSTALLVALPELTSTLLPWELEKFPAALQKAAGLVGIASVQGWTLGSAGFFSALEAAHELLDQREADRCIVVGVDTFMSEQRLGALDKAWRLRSDRNVDGFQPGEAAGAVVVERRANASTGLGAIRALAVTTESKPLTGDEQSTGSALTELLDRLVSSSKAERRFIVADLNGESYRAFEWGLALTRLGGRIGELTDLVHVATSVGDVGAASGALGVLSVLASFARGYASAPEAIVWCASDAGLRAGVRLEMS